MGPGNGAAAAALLALASLATEARADLPRARAFAAVDLDSGRTVCARNAAAARAPASTTKLVTAMVVVDRLPLDRRVVVSARAAAQPPSRAGLARGEAWTARDLLYALLLESGNDAATALAEATAGSEQAFARWMNAKARSLGCRASRFGNASGLPSGANRTTAAEMAKIAAAAWEDLLLREILSAPRATIRSADGRALSLRNHNRIVREGDGGVLGKTGYTRRAGKCFAGVIEEGGRRTAVAVLGSSSLWRDLSRLRASVRERPRGAPVRRREGVEAPASVREAQAALRRAGYDPGPADGIPGKRTRAALRSFQADRGLPRSGRLDGPTRSALSGL